MIVSALRRSSIVSNKGTASNAAAASGSPRTPCIMPHSFLQEEHFEQIAHRFGVADDVVPDRLLAEGFEQAWRGLEDLELFFGSFGVDDTGNAQRPWVTQESDKKSLLRWFVETGIVRRHARALEQLGERLFMPVRAFAGESTVAR